MKYTHIDQTFIDNLPTPTDKIKAEYRADNLPKGFRIEIRNTSKGIGTIGFAPKIRTITLDGLTQSHLNKPCNKQHNLSPHQLPPITPFYHP